MTTTSNDGIVWVEEDDYPADLGVQSTEALNIDKLLDYEDSRVGL